MSERRLITSYKPRLTIPVAEMQKHPDLYAMYCLPVDGANALRRIIAYLNREVTYFSTIVDGRSYFGPTTEELQAILDITAETEDFLMSPCSFDAIVDAMDRNTAAITALQCICDGLQRDASSNTFGDEIDELIDDGDVLPVLTQPDETIPPQQDDAACAIAQLYFQFTYEVITETVLPAAASTFDTLIPILAGIIAGIASGGMAAIAMYGIAELVQELIGLGYVVAEENYRNWLWSIKDDWICLAYNMLLEGANATEIAQAIKEDLIDASETISFGDKLVTSLFGGVLAIRNAKGAYIADTSWAQQNVTEGYCDECPEPPDPQCVTLDCDTEHWDTFGTPSNLGCDNGQPYCVGGYIRWLSTEIECPGDSFHLEIHWTAKTEDTNATFGIDLFFADIMEQLNVPDSQPLAHGQSRIETWNLTKSGGQGRDMTIQLVQTAWWGVVEKWCLRAGHL